MRVNDKGWLESDEGDQPLYIVPSIRFTKLAMKRPKAVIWHWSATVSQTAQALADSILAYDGDKDRAESWHVLIARDGSVYQSVSFLSSAWHVRRGAMIGPNYYQNLNKATVGIVLENAGRLKRVEDTWLQVPPSKKDSYGEAVPSEHVVTLKGGEYERYTSEQVASAIKVLGAIADAYEIMRKHCTYGHSTFEYPRYEDPGPLWLEHLLPTVLQRVFECPYP